MIFMSKKSLDQHSRQRSVMVSFRVSPEEAKLIDAQVSMSGLTKQEYILNRLLVREIKVVPSSRIHRALRNQMLAIYQELRRIRTGSEISPELEAVIEILVDEYRGLADEKIVSSVDTEDKSIKQLARNDAGTVQAQGQEE